MPTALLVEVRDGDARATLVAEPDADERRPAMFHAAGHAFAHLDVVLPPGLRDAIPRLATQLGAANLPTGALLDRLEAVPGVRVRRMLATTQPTPRWSVAMRTGWPGEGRLWPCDTELVALRRGHRHLIRREWLAGALGARDAAWLEGHGLKTALLPGGNGGEHTVLLAALDAEVLAMASALEPRTGDRGASWADAARGMGEALGYPPCCVARFVEIRRRDDAWLMADRLPDGDRAPVSARGTWIDPLALVSHAPCDPSCAATLGLAGSVLGAIERAHPGYEAQWRALAERVHVIDEEGRTLLVALEGGDRTVRDAVEVRAAADGLPLLEPRGDLTGESWSQDRFVVQMGSLARATLWADHRAP